MNHKAMPEPVIWHEGEGTQRWFFGGGIVTWKLSSANNADGLVVFETTMDKGKQTLMHTHPVAESLWLMAGQLRYRIREEDIDVVAGDFVMVPAGVAHGFMVVSEHARVLSIQGSYECEPFYLGASEPLEGSAQVTDFARIAESAAKNGGIEIVGPPPF